MVQRISLDGGWCWFQDPRIVSAGQTTFLGFVSNGTQNANARGEIRLAICENRNRRIGTREIVLDNPSAADEVSKFADDHNSPSMVKLPTDRLLAFWTLHGKENCFYIQEVDTSTKELIGEKRTVIVGDRSRITYSNPIFLSSEGRLYNFFRGHNSSWKPSWVYSDDEGNTWSEGRVLIDVPGKIRRRPYVKYASDGEDLIHFFFTEDHPGSFENNVYHVVYKSGIGLCDSKGNFISDIQTGISNPMQATRVFDSGEKQTAWLIDAKIDKRGSPRLLFQTREMSSGSKSESDSDIISYRLATIENGKWSTKYLAEAGPCLYSAQQDYVGLGCLNPNDLDLFIISTKVDPRTGKRLPYWTLFEGSLHNQSLDISWRKIVGTLADCIRPVQIQLDNGSSKIFWLEGKYTSFKNYDLSVKSKTLRNKTKLGLKYF